MKVSVIIPTFNDWGSLEKCITCLLNQAADKSCYELIVVNNSADHVTVPKFLQDSYARVKYITESKRGSYAARNRGLRCAEGEIIGFTDSDCLPDENWIGNALHHFQNESDLLRIAGKVELFYIKGRKTCTELYESAYAFDQKSNAMKGSSVTANMFARKEVFDKVGFFNEELLSGGDHEWGTRAHQAGINIHYKEDVVVMHPARSSFRELAKKAKRVAGGKYDPKRPTAYYFLKLLFDLRPPAENFRHIQALTGYSFREKIKIAVVFYLVRIIRAIEQLRVSLGHQPAR